LTDAVQQRVEADIVRAQRQLMGLSRLEGGDLITRTYGYAREDEFVQVFAKATPEERQRAGHVAVEVRNARLGEAGRKAGIIGVVDDQGRLVARDLSLTWRQGEDLKKDYPSLAMALAGTPNKDVWNIDGAMYRVGAAPVRGPQGNILGAVFVGYVQSVPDAAADREVLGVDVAYFLDGKIHASSLPHSENSNSETAEEKALAQQLFAEDGPKLAQKVTTESKPTPVFHVKVGSDELVAAAAPMPGNATPSKSGFVVLASLSGARAAAVPLSNYVLLLGFLGVFAAVGAAVMTARRFLLPLDKIEAGVSEVINGNHDYVFNKVSLDFEGLCNGLNVMLARLLGRPEPGEEDEEGGDDMSAMEQ
jgi:hypothetical protein